MIDDVFDESFVCRRRSGAMLSVVCSHGYKKRSLIWFDMCTAMPIHAPSNRCPFDGRPTPAFLCIYIYTWYIDVVVRGHPGYIPGFPVIIKSKRFVHSSAQLCTGMEGKQRRWICVRQRCFESLLFRCVKTFGTISNEVVKRGN